MSALTPRRSAPTAPPGPAPDGGGGHSGPGVVDSRPFWAAHPFLPAPSSPAKVLREGVSPTHTRVRSPRPDLGF
ncbi:hypothetical protein P7K49_000428 [Saguinus oedipus]|uniref:Uncharacterized protein n=1 Tax=Saguinus oedipus TaxID=9490 RepID=A0ABQ9WBM3_SAGOE|nr:hypothetical protein P7K49_000428 [Saguinus oedipus]